MRDVRSPIHDVRARRRVLPLVVKKDGRREAFERAKVLAGLRRALRQARGCRFERIEQLVDAIERELIDGGEKEIAATIIGARVMAHLREVDPVAYVRFASVYRQFQGHRRAPFGD